MTYEFSAKISLAMNQLRLDLIDKYRQTNCPYWSLIAILPSPALFILCKQDVFFQCRDRPFKGEKIHLSA